MKTFAESSLSNWILLAALAALGILEAGWLQARIGASASTWAGYQALLGLGFLLAGSTIANAIPQREASPRNPPLRIAGLLGMVLGVVAGIAGVVAYVYLVSAD